MPKPRQSGHRGKRARRRAMAPATSPQAVSPTVPRAVKPAQAVPGGGATPAMTRRVPAPAPPALPNKYIGAELRRIGIIAGAMIIFLIILAFFLR